MGTHANAEVNDFNSSNYISSLVSTTSQDQLFMSNMCVTFLLPSMTPGSFTPGRPHS